MTFDPLRADQCFISILSTIYSNSTRISSRFVCTKRNCCEMYGARSTLGFIRLGKLMQKINYVSLGNWSNRLIFSLGNFVFTLTHNHIQNRIYSECLLYLQKFILQLQIHVYQVTHKLNWLACSKAFVRFRTGFPKLITRIVSRSKIENELWWYRVYLHVHVYTLIMLMVSCRSNLIITASQQLV